MRTADELEAAIAKVEAKRAELEARQPSSRASARELAMLPRAAEEFRKQLALGLEGSERDVLRRASRCGGNSAARFALSQTLTAESSRTGESR
jgi:hypothetical protein